MPALIAVVMAFAAYAVALACSFTGHLLGMCAAAAFTVGFVVAAWRAED